MFFRPRQVRNHIEHFEVDEAKEIRRLYRLVCENVLFVMPFIYIHGNVIFLPRQARDKHRETHSKWSISAVVSGQRRV